MKKKIIITCCVSALCILGAFAFAHLSGHSHLDDMTKQDGFRCPSCNGTGFFGNINCNLCRGTGRSSSY